MKKLISPTGSAIVGTAERLYGTALILNENVERAADGSFEFQYGGETEIDWDSQETERVGGKDGAGPRLFVDENGLQWPETELRLVEVPE